MSRIWTRGLSFTLVALCALVMVADLDAGHRRRRRGGCGGCGGNGYASGGYSGGKGYTYGGYGYGGGYAGYRYGPAYGGGYVAPGTANAGFGATDRNARAVERGSMLDHGLRGGDVSGDVTLAPSNSATANSDNPTTENQTRGETQGTADADLPPTPPAP